MKVIVYGDFNCPYSYLASQRSARLARDGMTEIDWRAVEHDPKLAMTGTPADHAVWDKELAEVAALARPGEDAPAAPPPVISNTRAAVAAYAEAVSDGIAGELRRRLFGAIWGQKRHLSSAYEVRRLVTRLMWRPGCITDRLASPDLHRAPVRRHHRAGRRAAHHGRLAADPAVAGGLAGAAQPGDSRGHRPGPDHAVRHRGASLPGRS
jgi:2-hydroxychromene-2-carboxylate isomerase